MRFLEYAKTPCTPDLENRFIYWMACSFRAQESFRMAKGEEEVTLYNTKRRRVTHASFRVGFYRLMNYITGIDASTV